MRNYVLIVDDKKKFLATFQKQCDEWFKKNKSQMDVVARTSTQEAKAFLKKEGGSVELAIVDIRLPTTLRGSEFLAYIKKNYPTIRRIAITAEADRGEVGAMVANRLFHGYVDKDWWDPHKKNKIWKEIKRVLNEPCDISAHSSIVAAIEQWLEQDPKMNDKKLTAMSGEETTIAQILNEIKKGTSFGKQQERTIFRIACDLFSTNIKK